MLFGRINIFTDMVELIASYITAFDNKIYYKLYFIEHENVSTVENDYT